MENKFKPGDRVRLTCDFPDPSRFSPQHLMKGDIGIVEEHRNVMGFYSERIGGLHFSQTLDGKRVNILDYCELVETSPSVAISSILASEDAPKKLNCAICGRPETVDRITWECELCGANFRDEDDAEDCAICGSAADEKIAVCKECAVDLSQDFPEVEKRPVRYEIKTLLQDISEDLEADNSLSQLLNDGWEILELSHHVVDELDGETIIREFRRVVSLRRTVTGEKFTVVVGGEHKQEPHEFRIEVPATDADYFIDGVGFKATREETIETLVDNFKRAVRNTGYNYAEFSQEAEDEDGEDG